MRAVVRFIAQCHAKGLIYRDIKPGAPAVRLCSSVLLQCSFTRIERGVVPRRTASLTPNPTPPHPTPTPTPTIFADNFLLVNKVKMDGAADCAALFCTELSYSAASGSGASEPERNADGSGGAAVALVGAAAMAAARPVPLNAAANILPAGRLHVWKHITRKVSPCSLPGCFS